MALSEAIKVFGPPEPAAGTRVIERIGVNALTEPRIGAIAMFMVAKRGPSGIPIPVSNRQEYDRIFGDPGDPRYHLFTDSAHMGPDAIDGFFATSGGSGKIFVTRLDLEGKGKRAEAVLKNRFGVDVLRIRAANEGRWGGCEAHIPSSAIIVATSRTFTVAVPGIESNEFIGAYASFSSGSGKKYAIVANTESDPQSGEVIFTVGAQFDLLADGINGPIALRGTSNYARRRDLTGTITFPTEINLTGTLTVPADGRTITGNGTLFTRELTIGANLYYLGEARSVESISSDTTLTVDEPFTSNGTNVTAQRDNRTVNGNGTLFTTETTVGDILYVRANGIEYGRTVSAIASPTSLTLDSGFPVPLPAGTTLRSENLWVQGGADSDFAADVRIGDAIIDPNRRGDVAKVIEIDATGRRFRIDAPFSADFSNAQLVKQSQEVQIDLMPSRQGEGLSVEVGLGTKNPQTHFSLTIRFNKSVVLNFPDCSLDPNDEAGLFVDTLVNDSNIAYRSGATNYQTWVTVESLWGSTYTTAPTNDVRPFNGAGIALEVTPRRIYVADDFNFTNLLNAPLYLSPYRDAGGAYRYVRESVRVKGAQAPVSIEGTISSTGVNITGTATNFLNIFKRGDYLYDPGSKTARKVRSVISNTQLTVETVFPRDIPALTQAKKAGYLQVDQGMDLTTRIKAGSPYVMAFPEYLRGGYDGDLGKVQPYHFTKFLNPDVNYLEKAVWGRNLGLVRMACPGVSSVTVQRAGVEYASQKAFEFRAEVPSYYNSSAAIEAFVEELGRSDFVMIASHGYAYVANPFGIGDRMVPTSGDIMGLESYRATLHGGWHYPTAGMNARLNRFTRLAWEIDPHGEADLNAIGVQPIKRLGGAPVIFGARVPSVNSIYTHSPIRRTQSHYVRFFLEAREILENLFRPNQPDVAERLILILEGFARSEFNKGVYNNYLTFDQAIHVSAITPQAPGQGAGESAARDVAIAMVNGQLHIYYSYFPAGYLERLYLNVGPEIATANYAQSFTAI